jgi:ERCC4-type nuclease
MSDVRRFAAMLPGIGYHKSAVVEKHFGSIEEMATADAGTWMEIDGIGKKLAADIVRFCKGRK